MNASATGHGPRQSLVDVLAAAELGDDTGTVVPTPTDQLADEFTIVPDPVGSGRRRR